jgi:hypothetical protein
MVFNVGDGNTDTAGMVWYHARRTYIRLYAVVFFLLYLFMMKWHGIYEEAYGQVVVLLCQRGTRFQLRCFNVHKVLRLPLSTAIE